MNAFLTLKKITYKALSVVVVFAYDLQKAFVKILTERVIRLTEGCVRVLAWIIALSTEGLCKKGFCIA